MSCIKSFKETKRKKTEVNFLNFYFNMIVYLSTLLYGVDLTKEQSQQLREKLVERAKNVL